MCFTRVGCSSAPLSRGLAGTVVIQHAADSRASAKRSKNYFMVQKIQNWIGLQYRKDRFFESLFYKVRLALGLESRAYTYLSFIVT